MTTSTATAATAGTATGAASALRRLYLVRFGFAIVWAALLFPVAEDLGPLTVVLLVLYPLVDVAAAVVDLRSSRATGAVTGLAVNIAISLLATAGVAVAVTSGIPAVLRVWGAWAIVAGLVQLVVGVGRRGLGGQWAMIASGAISAVAGATFVLQAGAAGAALTTVAGYAVPGGIFFLVSALRLARPARSA